MSAPSQDTAVRTGVFMRAAIYALLILFAVYFLLPLYVMLVNSMKPVTEERYAELASGVSTPSGLGFVGVTRDPELAIDPKELFGFEALAKRYDFKATRDAEDIPSAGKPEAPM